MRSQIAPLGAILVVACAGIASAQGSFVNFESPHVHPLELTPDGTRLLAVNTADNRLEVFAVLPAQLAHIGSVPVGLDPTSVRARSNGEAWVVNHLSDSVSVVDLATLRVRATFKTQDEPNDVAFAGTTTSRAFVSSATENTVSVFDPNNLTAAPTLVPIFGVAPRAIAVSSDFKKVYVAIFDSGNQSTVLGGGGTMANVFPPNVVSNPAGPYGGQNPPPNAGNAFNPPIAAGLPAPPKVGLIVKKDATGKWMDDNAHDWTALVSGNNASLSGRPVGWDLPDHDVAVIDADSLGLTYADHLMNLDMALAVNPANGEVVVVGTEATNEIRFEPNLKGKFVHVVGSRITSSGAFVATKDLNPHLTYGVSSIPQSDRDKSLGDPRGVAFSANGSRVFVTGMGSNNLVAFDSTLTRVGTTATTTIPVGEGPTGVVAHPLTGMVFVLNKFEGSVSCVDPVAQKEVDRTALAFDPTPSVIKVGRKHLYDTHKNSGLGQIACASCHIDARIDHLAWDLGDPSGAMKATTGQNLGANVPGLNTGFQPWHPMKGPMTTQSLQDIVGKEPLHWRGDRAGLEEFAPAFKNLQGDDVQLLPAEMQEFEDFIASIHYPPNPYRNFDNTLTTAMNTGVKSNGRFSPKGTALPVGNAQHGATIYRPPTLLDAAAIACSSCHTLPVGIGTNSKLVGFAFQPIATGPNGELHHMLVSQDGNTNITMKVPQLRNMYEKRGFDTNLTSNVAGFGYLHDGSVDTLASFLSEPVFNPGGDQDLADLVAFLFQFAGSDLAYGGSILEPPATSAKDAHAAVGQQTTLIDSGTPAAGQLALIDQMVTVANTNKVGLVVKGIQGGLARGYYYVGGNSFQSDRSTETRTVAQLKSSAAPGSELTFTVVPFESRVRIGVDRDEDGWFDRDEIDALTNPNDPTNYPGCGSALAYGQGCPGSGNRIPRVQVTGCLKQNGNVVFTLDKGNPNALALLVFGLTQAAQPIGGGCYLNVAPMLPPLVGPFPLDANGSISFPAAIPAGVGAGVVTMQGIVQDAGVPIGFTTTNGLQLTFSP